MHNIGIHDVSQILDSIHVEWAFLYFGIQLLLSQGVEDLLNVLQMFYLGFVVDEDAI